MIFYYKKYLSLRIKKIHQYLFFLILVNVLENIEIIVFTKT
jgi:hypothetical protein